MGRVYVAGSINMDVVAKAPHHPVVGETVLGNGLQFVPGGKGANQAVAACKLGAETFIVGCVGQDHFGAELSTFLKKGGVNLENLRTVDTAATGTALIVVDSAGENTIVVVPGANAFLTADDVESVPCKQNDVLVAQFEVPIPTVQAFFQLGRSRGTINILNPAPAQKVPAELLALTDVLVLNESELNLLIGGTVTSPAAIDGCRKLQAFQTQVVVLTLGAEGVIALAGSQVIWLPGHRVKVVDTTGAGDCFVGALASKLAIGMAIEPALEFANKAAAISVQRFGAGPSMPDLEEVHSFQ